MSTRSSILYQGDKFDDLTLEDYVHVWRDVIDDSLSIQCISDDAELATIHGPGENDRRVLVTLRLPDQLGRVLKAAIRAYAQEHKAK